MRNVNEGMRKWGVPLSSVRFIINNVIANIISTFKHFHFFHFSFLSFLIFVY